MAKHPRGSRRRRRSLATAGEMPLRSAYRAAICSSSPDGCCRDGLIWPDVPFWLDDPMPLVELGSFWLDELLPLVELELFAGPIPLVELEPELLGPASTVLAAVFLLLLASLWFATLALSLASV